MSPGKHVRLSLPGTGNLATTSVMIGLGAPIAAAVVAAVTLDVPWALKGAPSRGAVEMASVLVGLLASYLLFCRAQAGRRGRDLVLAWGVGLMAVVEGALSLLPQIVSRDLGAAILQIDAIARVLVSVVLAVAALAPARLLDRAGRRAAQAMGVGLLAVLVVLFASAAANSVDADTVVPPIWREGVHLAAALIAVVAGVAFAVRAVRERSELLVWVAGAVVLFGIANLDAAYDPSLPPDWITTCDVLHFGAALMLLAGALRQLGSYPGPAARRAISQERRRIARDLHDGLAQELAFIVAQAPHIAAGTDDPVGARLAEAAASALEESRLAISLLGEDSRASLELALRRTAELIAERTGRVVRVELEEGIEVEPAIRSDLLRIAREATTNAVRHGDASEVLISLTGGAGVVLRIADDGVGFRSDDVAPGLARGFGLTSMRERAERAGGQLQMWSEPGRGTVVEVRIA